MPTGDSNITLTIQAVDASGPVLQNLETRILATGAAAEGTTSKLKSATAELGAIGTAGTTSAASMQAFGAAGVAGAEQSAAAMGRLHGNMRMVSGEARELGVHLPYSMRAFLAESPGVISALHVMSGLFIGIAAIDIGAQLVKGLHHLYEEWFDVTKAVEAYQQKASEAAEQKLFNTASIEETKVLLKEVGDQITELGNKQIAAGADQPGGGLAQYVRYAQHYFPLGGAAAISQSLQPEATPPYTTKDDAQKAKDLEDKDKLLEHQLQGDQQAAQEKLKGQREFDSVALQGYAKRAALDRDEAERINQEYDFKAKQEENLVRIHNDGIKAMAAAGKDVSRETVETYAPHAFDQQRAAELAAVQQQSAGERVALARKEQEEIIRAQNEAVDAGLKGEALLLAKRNQDVDAIVRKVQTGELSMQAAAAETAAAYQRYDNERLERIQKQYDEAEKMEREAAAAGLTGLPKIQAEQANKLADLNQSWQSGTYDIGADWKKRQAIAAQTDADIAEAHQRFTERIAQMDQHAADQLLSGYAKINAEAKNSIDELTRAYTEFYGKDQSQWQGYQDAKTQILVAADRERQKYSEQVDREISATEDQAARALLPPWEQSQQKIIDDYNQRLQKIHDEVTQQVITEQQGAREVQAAWDLANAEMERQAEQSRDQLAGTLSSLFDNPEKFLKQRAKQMMLDIVANWVETLENSNSAVGGALRGILGQGGQIGTQNNPLSALGEIFGVHAGHAGIGSQIDAGSTLSTAGATLQSSGTILSSAGAQLLSAAQALHFVLGGGTGASGGGGGGFGTESLGIPGGLSGAGGGGFFGSGATSSLGGNVVGGIGQAASTAQGIASAAGVNTGPLGQIIGGAQTAGQIAQQANLFSSAASTAQLLNPGGVPGVPGGFQPSDINQPPTNDAGVLGTLPGSDEASSGSSLSASSSLGIAGAGLSTALGLVQAWQSGNTGQAVLTGALGGAGIGTAILPGIGTAIGAAAGALVGFVGSLFSDNGASKARNYNIQQVIPQLQQLMYGFSGGQSDYDQSSLAINNLQIQAQKQCYAWGSGAIDVYKNTILPEITNAQNQVNREGAAGRSNVTFSAAQFDQGGQITDFGDLWTSGTTGFIHAQLGEHVLTEMDAAAARPRSLGSSVIAPGPRETGAANSYVRGAGGVLGGSSGGTGATVHLHVHTIDAQDTARWLRNGGAMQIQQHINENTGRYSGKALSARG